MLTPQQLADAPNNMVRLYQQLEDDIIADIAEKIAAQDYFTAASDWQVQKLVVMNNSYKDILKKLSAATGKTQAEIRRLMEEAASESLKYDDAIYNAAGVNLATLNQSAALLNTLNAGIKKTEGVFVNLCKTTAIQTSRQLVRELDAAYMKVSSGAFSPDAAIDSACRSLAKDGMTAFYYESGRRISLEAAVRLNIRTGVAQTCAKIQEQRLQEAGCELVQTTAHLGARPSHVPWQGKVFMMNGRSEKYGNLEEETGYGTVTGLCGANCRHNFFPFYEGISVNQYTQESLDELAAKKVRYNGEDIGVYEATQKQRALERKVREAKRYKEAAKAAGISTAKADANLRRATDELSNFTAQTGLKRQYGREKIFPLAYEKKLFSVGSEIQAASRVLVDENDKMTVVRSLGVISAKRIVASKYGYPFYISDEEKITIQEFKRIEERLNTAVKKLKINPYDVPPLVIAKASEFERQDLALYNYPMNYIGVTKEMALPPKELKKLQATFACSDKTSATFVHELIHWQDAERYRRTGRFNEKYIENLREEHKNIIAKLEKQGYNVVVSPYAAAKNAEGEFDEVYTEFRVKQLYK